MSVKQVIPVVSHSANSGKHWTHTAVFLFGLGLGTLTPLSIARAATDVPTPDDTPSPTTVTTPSSVNEKQVVLPKVPAQKTPIETQQIAPTTPVIPAEESATPARSQSPVTRATAEKSPTTLPAPRVAAQQRSQVATTPTTAPTTGPTVQNWLPDATLRHWIISSLDGATEENLTDYVDAPLSLTSLYDDFPTPITTLSGLERFKNLTTFQLYDTTMIRPEALKNFSFGFAKNLTDFSLTSLGLPTDDSAINPDSLDEETILKNPGALVDYDNSMDRDPNWAVPGAEFIQHLLPDNPNLQGLSLVNLGLSGSLPDFTAYPHLTDVNLNMNDFSGPLTNLPPKIADQEPDLTLNLQDNQLSGDIPDLTQTRISSLYADGNHLATGLMGNGSVSDQSLDAGTVVTSQASPTFTLNALIPRVFHGIQESDGLTSPADLHIVQLNATPNYHEGPKYFWPFLNYVIDPQAPDMSVDATHYFTIHQLANGQVSLTADAQAPSGHYYFIVYYGDLPSESGETHSNYLAEIHFHLDNQLAPAVKPIDPLFPVTPIKPVTPPTPPITPEVPGPSIPPVTPTTPQPTEPTTPSPVTPPATSVTPQPDTTAPAPKPGQSLATQNGSQSALPASSKQPTRPVPSPESSGTIHRIIPTTTARATAGTPVTTLPQTNEHRSLLLPLLGSLGLLIALVPWLHKHF